MEQIKNPFLNRVSSRKIGHTGRVSEKATAKRLKGRQQPGSGAVDGGKGDIKKETLRFEFLIENKSTATGFYPIYRNTLLKIYQEALEIGRVPALTLQFTTDSGKSEVRDRWVLIPESVFSEIIEE